MDFRVKRLSRIRNPEAGIPALVCAPAAEEARDRVRDRVRPAGERLYKLRRRIATAAVAALTVWLFLHVMFSANGMVTYQQKRSEIEVLRKDVEALQGENEDYTRQIKALKTDPKAIEKEAREQLHYARPGEVIYVSPPPPPPRSKPVNNSAQNSK